MCRNGDEGVYKFGFGCQGFAGKRIGGSGGFDLINSSLGTGETGLDCIL